MSVFDTCIDSNLHQDISISLSLKTTIYMVSTLEHLSHIRYRSEVLKCSRNFPSSIRRHFIEMQFARGQNHSY